MKKSLLNIFAVLICLLMMLTAAVPVFAAELDAVDTGVNPIWVSRTDISTFGFAGAVQNALNTARDHATAENPYIVIVPEGSYDLNGVLRMYSNTTLEMYGVTLRRTGSGNMLRVGSEDGVNTGAVGYVYENIRLSGGTFDGNLGENTIIKAFHTRNFMMQDCTLMNEKNGHMMEYAGIDGLTIRGCSFSNQQLTPGNFGYEVIQLDVLHPFHITNGRCEDLPCTNVLIEDCTFSDMPRAIGSHTSVLNNPHRYITIRNNSFINMSSIAIQGMNWMDVDICNNYIENSPRGITVYAAPGGCTYLSSLLASKGGTSVHASDGYQAPQNSNITIRNNVLKSIGTSADQYARYSSQGIAVIGENLTAQSPVDSSDESGGLPAGDYYLDRVSIRDNYIDIRGNGIRVEDARNAAVENNVILCSKNTVFSDNYYGIVLRNNVQALSVSGNTIENAEINGMQIADSKVNSISCNCVNGTGKYGIVSYRSELGSIIDNDIISSATQGLCLIDSSADKVRRNRARQCGSEGLYFTSSSSAKEVAANTTFSCGGNITYSKSAGKVKVGSNYTNSAKLTQFSLKQGGARMGVGAVLKIIPAVEPPNALARFTYSSSAPAVAAVDAYGRVTAVGVGNAVITVSSDNGISKTYPIEVFSEGDVVYFDEQPREVRVYLLGDADGDNEIGISDVTTIQRYLSGMIEDFDGTIVLCGDLGSDALDITDASFIQRWLADMQVPYPIGTAMAQSYT